MARASKSQRAENTASSAAQPVSLKREAVRGIQLNVPGRELVVRLADRIRWHRERADALIAQMTKLAQVEHEAADDLVGVLGRYDSPRVALEKKVREHQERATFLTFVRDHVNPEDLYRLDSADLRMTEILPDKPW